jgi:hypothetical protein
VRVGGRGSDTVSDSLVATVAVTACTESDADHDALPDAPRLAEASRVADPAERLGDGVTPRVGVGGRVRLDVAVFSDRDGDGAFDIVKLAKVRVRDPRRRSNVAVPFPDPATMAAACAATRSRRSNGRTITHQAAGKRLRATNNFEMMQTEESHTHVHHEFRQQRCECSAA